MRGVRGGLHMPRPPRERSPIPRGSEGQGRGGMQGWAFGCSVIRSARSAEPFTRHPACYSPPMLRCMVGRWMLHLSMASMPSTRSGYRAAPSRVEPFT